MRFPTYKSTLPTPGSDVAAFVAGLRTAPCELSTALKQNSYREGRECGPRRLPSGDVQVSALVAVFAQAYRDTNRAIAPLQRAGIAREMLNANQAARPFWTESLDLADRLGLLPRVVEIATTDPTIAAFHRPISLAYEAHLSEQAAAGAAPAPPTPIDPGSPVTAEQAEATLTRLLAAAAAKGYAKGLADERRRCTQHAHRLALRAFSAPVEYPAVLATAEAISSGKPAP